MRATKHITLADAVSREIERRRRHGIPEDGSGKPGVNVGGGIHAPAEMSRTYRYAEVVKHPAADEWAVPIDAADEEDVPAKPIEVDAKPLDPKAQPKGEPLAATAAVVDLGADWFPPPGVL